MIRWPDKLILDVARRTCVLYIGAGISINSKAPDGSIPPSWEDFLKIALDSVRCDRKYIEQLLSEKDLLLACEVIINRIGSHAFNEIAQNCFRRPGFNPAEIHTVIYDLDSRLIITPNVDKIYDQYALSTSRGTVVIKNYNELDTPNFIRSQDRLILKAHGSIDRPDEMIFSRYDYNSARYEYRRFYKILDSLALTHTYIFLGCGLNDPDIKLTLENYNFGFPGCRPHYFITAEESINPDIKESLLKNCNIELLTYSNPDCTHQHLLLSLKELVEVVENTRSDLAETQNW